MFGHVRETFGNPLNGSHDRKTALKMQRFSLTNEPYPQLILTPAAQRSPRSGLPKGLTGRGHWGLVA
jgi:hypothetical protein